MNDRSYSAMLRRLAREYSQSHLAFEQYRVQRKIILDKIDEQFNGRKSYGLQTEPPEQAALSMNTIAYFERQ